MIKLLLYYLIASATILPYIDYWRRKKRMGQVLNIDHKVSVWLAIGMGLVIPAVLHSVFKITLNLGVWKGLAAFSCYAIGCVGVRLFIYDIALALMNRQNPFKNSLTSSSKTEQYENNHKIDFWQQRGLGVLGIGIAFLIKYLIK